MKGCKKSQPFTPGMARSRRMTSGRWMVSARWPSAAVAGEQHLKSGLAQRGGEHAAQRQIVVDDEDPFPIDIGDSFFAAAALILNLIHAALALAILATAETDMQNAGHSSVRTNRCRRTCSKGALGDARAGVGQIERNAHQRHSPADQASIPNRYPAQNTIKPFRPRRKPAIDAIDRIARRDMPQKNIRRRTDIADRKAHLPMTAASRGRRTRSIPRGGATYGSRR